MIEERGRVVAREGDAVWVETLRRRTCDGCSARHGCGHRLLDSARSGARARVRALVDGEPPEPGATVVVGIPEGALLRAAAMAYLLPVILLLAGALAGAWIAPQGSLPALVGLVGLVIGFLCNRWYSQGVRARETMHPRLVRRENTCPPPPGRIM